MFQTVSHRGGFVQVSNIPGCREVISAFSHGTRLGDHYRSVAGAKTAITRAHRQWLREFNRDYPTGGKL